VRGKMVFKLRELLAQPRESEDEQKRHISQQSRGGVFGVSPSFSLILLLHGCLTERKKE
jgi:hypothetical protein